MREREREREREIECARDRAREERARVRGSEPECDLARSINRVLKGGREGEREKKKRLAGA